MLIAENRDLLTRFEPLTVSAEYRHTLVMRQGSRLRFVSCTIYGQGIVIATPSKLKTPSATRCA